MSEENQIMFCVGVLLLYLVAIIFFCYNVDFIERVLP